MRGLRTLLLASVLLLLTACGGAPAPSAPAAPAAPSGALGRIAATGELRVCSTGDYAPLTVRAPDGSWSGIDVDMAGDLARSLGARVTMVPTTWSTLLDDVVAGRCDVAVGGVSVTPDRAARAAFTIPYLDDGKTPIVRCPDVARYAEVAQIDRPDVRVVVNPGGTNERFARERLTRATIVGYPDNATIHDTLADGRADVMVTDAIEARWQAARRPGVLCAVHPDRPFTRSQKAYLTPAGDPDFTARVNTWLRRALDDGTWQRLARPWLG